MEKLVKFRDYQEEQAQDHTDLQEYARASLDHIISDAVTATRRFSGFNTVKSAQAEITIAPGRFFDVTGAVHARNSSLVQSVVSYLAASTKRIVTLTAYGVENDSDVEERDYLTNVETGATEPKAVAMTSSRDAVLAFEQGNESADPQPPTVPAGRIAIAHILLDTTQVVSVTMVDANKVSSTENLDQRSKVLEAFKDQIGPRVASLASDLAALAARIGQQTGKAAFARVFQDLARVKEKLRFPEAASDYGADFYLNQDDSDVNDVATLGYDAKVEEGVRFADANADQFEIKLFSNNDPNAGLSNGVLLPKYAQEVKIFTGVWTSDLGIAQYGFQTIEMKQGYMSRSRLRYGGSLSVCSNGSNWNSAGQPTDLTGLYDLESTQFSAIDSIYYDPDNWAHEAYRSNTWWYDTWKEPYMYAVAVDHTISGAMVAQSFLVSNDMWCPMVQFAVTSKGGNENIHVSLCEVTNGVPDLDKVVAKVTWPHASTAIGWNYVPIPPTFLAKGKRYALVLVSNANHKVGMVSGQNYLEGTFFYSTDGAYYQGDLTKDMAIVIWGCKFLAPQVTIEFEPINLDGGFRLVDILAEMWAPDSTQLVFEVRPNGSGEWLPLVADNAGVLAAAPALAQFRARFVGTRDMMPALTLVGSRVNVSRPKTAGKHVSTVKALDVASDEIHVTVLLENFDDTPHDHTMTLRVGSTNESPDTTTTKLIDIDAKRYEREYVFNLTAPITSFRVVQSIATNSPQNTFHVAERVYYAL
jgi:hypothetical protein